SRARGYALGRVGRAERPPPEPLPVPMFGQLPLCWVPPEFGLAGCPDVPGPDGCVVLGVGDGSAAFTTATPPTMSSPAASSAVAMLRRAPPRACRGAAGWGAVGAVQVVGTAAV